MYKEIVNKRKKKNELQRCYCKQDKVKEANLWGLISTWFSNLQPEAVVLQMFFSSQMFFKIGVLKSFAKFTGKHLYQSLSFNKVAASGLQNVKNTFCLRIPLVAASVQLYR